MTIMPPAEHLPTLTHAPLENVTHTKLAVNYSPQAAALRLSGDLPIDLYKCPDWPDLIAEAVGSGEHPVYVHFPLVAGDGSLDAVDWSRVERLLGETHTPFVNLHLAPHAKTFQGDPESAATRGKILSALCREIEGVGARFGAERVILENVPYYPEESRLRLGVLPETVTTLVRDVGCGFLFDLSHARISAHYLGADEKDYIAALPLDKLRELHITGVQMHEGRLRDHLPLTEKDWEMAAWASSQIRTGAWARPGVVALEYGGVGPAFEWRSDSGVLTEQVPRLYRLIHAGADTELDVGAGAEVGAGVNAKVTSR